MGVIKTRLAALEKTLFSLIPPGEIPVTFIFENGEKVTFPNGHAALIYAIKNRKNDMQVTIETEDESKAGFAKAVLAGDKKK